MNIIPPYMSFIIMHFCGTCSVFKGCRGWKPFHSSNYIQPLMLKFANKFANKAEAVRNDENVSALEGIISHSEKENAIFNKVSNLLFCSTQSLFLILNNRIETSHILNAFSRLSLCFLHDSLK